MKKILQGCHDKKVAIGIHIVNPSHLKVKKPIEEGYFFIAYFIDSVMLEHSIGSFWDGLLE